MPLHNYVIYAALIIAAALAAVTKKLTIAGSFTGAMIGLLIFAATGYTGLLMLTAFFMCGTAATAYQRKQKEVPGTDDSGPRTAGQVIANGGVAAILAIIALIFPGIKTACLLMMAGSLASAAADTLSSELGTVFGRKFYNIVTFKKDQRGLDGVVSIEGTAIGILGSAVIALIYAAGTDWNSNFIRIIIAGTIGNLADSLFGAVFERKHQLTNNQVNFLNTLVGALMCWLLNRFI